MRLKNLLYINLVCLALATITPWSAGTASAGLTCKSMVWGNGWHSYKQLARMKARQSWRANAGPGWNNIALAKNKSLGCRKQYKPGQHGAGTKKWRCVFKARPCKKLGISG